MKKLIAIIISLMVLPNLSWGHSMSPGFEVEWAITPKFVKEYTITNTTKHASVFKINVYEKDWSESTGWEVQFDEYRINADNKAIVKIRFDASYKRKVYVCSSLTEIGKKGHETGVITRVCSRLIINAAPIKLKKEQ